MTAERRKFTKKFKLEVVQAYLDLGVGGKQQEIADRYKIGKSAVSNWVSLYGGRLTRGAKPRVVERERKAVAPAASDALANVVSAIEPLGREDRRTVIEAVLRLLPP